MYNNEELRHSFSVEIHKCNLTENINCKNDSDIEEFLKQTYFTLNMVDNNIEFLSKKEVPIRSGESFHSQFQLSLNSYLDNNNFLRINRITTKDARFNILQDPNVYFFLDLKKEPSW